MLQLTCHCERHRNRPARIEWACTRCGATASSGRECHCRKPVHTWLCKSQIKRLQEQRDLRIYRKYQYQSDI